MNNDVLVVGSGVAGASAALAFLRLPRDSQTPALNAVLIEARDLEQAPGRPDWITAGAIKQLGELGVDVSAVLGRPFAGVAFHSTDFKRSTTSPEKGGRPPGFRVDYTKLAVALRQAALAGGATAVQAHCARLKPAEAGVVAELTGADAQAGRFALLSCGAGEPLAEGHTAGQEWLAQVVCQVDAKAADDSLHWMLERRRIEWPVLWWFEGNRCIATRRHAGTAADAGPELVALLDEAASAGAVPGQPRLEQAVVSVRPAPARTALDLESHVDKQVLRIGDAGGFVAAASMEGICPAIWSARLAAQTCAKAAAGPHPQDQLREFSTAWRSEMGEYLRLPNTDLHFLLPLVFTNAQMAQKLAAAIWRGENI